MESNKQLALGTAAMTVSFAAWGLISAFAPRFREVLHLSATETALLVAVPVLLGSLARILMGILTDVFGGRVIFSVLMIFTAIPVFLIPGAQSYPMLLALGFWLGVAGASFAVGVPFVSRWFPPEKQGIALGIYGLGNIGLSAAVFFGPTLAKSLGFDDVFRGLAALLVAMTIIFGLFARNAPVRAKPGSLAAMTALLARERLAWVLSGFYFLTFGGFVAFSIYLPSLLKDQFGLTAADAGLRAGGFVVLATLLRPVGGLLADKIGGSRLLSTVFFGCIPFSLLLIWPSIVPFTVGALGCAALMGLGNGAVFKLVPQHFPRDTGTVTGLVSAMGGLGGFFPPLVLGVFRDRLGVAWPGFALLTVTAFIMWRLNARIFLPRERAAEARETVEHSRTADRLRAGAWATVFAGLLVAGIAVGSRNLQNFDSALVIYTFAVVFATWGVVYHYNVWLEKPPTRLYWDRGWELFRKRPISSFFKVGGTATTHLLAQNFIRHRSRLRWAMHQCLFWGCMLAMAITFPLVFGWIGFKSSPADQMTYVAYLFGFPAGSFQLHTLIATTVFHVLDVSAILVLVGVSLSLWRRLRDQGAQTVQSFATDFVPIMLLFAIAVTGLALTASQQMGGELYGFLAILHAITVIAGLLSLPFGKFFHIFQRPAQLGIKLYKEAGDADEGSHCPRCGARFASKLHIEDLRTILPKVGFDYSMPGPAGHWQALCPACKRRSLSAAQLRIKGTANYG
jgi:NNP family nitrate/nitrite transporter-like MFS transporter